MKYCIYNQNEELEDIKDFSESDLQKFKTNNPNKIVLPAILDEVFEEVFDIDNYDDLEISDDSYDVVF